MLKNIRDYFNWFQPRKIPKKTLIAFRRLLGQLHQDQRIEVQSWLTNVYNIQTDDILTPKEKLQLLKKLPTSNIIVEFIKSSIVILAADGPIKDKVFLRRLLEGAGLFTVGINLRVAGALYALKASLPYFLRSDVGSRFIGFLKTEIESLEDL